ncbi:DUF1122 family protein [Aquifex pyrophilus]
MLSPKDFETLKRRLEEGIKTDLGKLSLKRFSRGRFVEEFNLDLSVDGESLLTVKVFLGRKPHYGPWAEIFGIRPQVKGKSFFGSSCEREVYKLFSSYFPKIFVEYFEDRETAKELQRGVPPALSRMGFELLKLGYTYFRDWYIPEGLMEGGHKIQAEKPRDEETREKHLSRLEEELKAFLEGEGDESLKEKVLERYNQFKCLRGKS